MLGAFKAKAKELEILTEVLPGFFLGYFIFGLFPSSFQTILRIVFSPFDVRFDVASRAFALTCSLNRKLVLAER